MMTSGVKRAGGRRRGGLLATAGSERSVPWLVIGVCLILEPAPHGVNVKPDLVRVEEPETLAAIGQDHKFRCSAMNTSGLVWHTRSARDLLPDAPLGG